MAFWIVRAGKYGDNETYALDNGVVVVGWDDLADLSLIPDRESLQEIVDETYPDEKKTTTRMWTGELWAFKARIANGDLVALPLKTRSAIAIGRVRGPYRHIGDAPGGARHQRPVQWLRTDIPRSDVDQDLLYSLGSTLAVFQISRNNAEERFLAIVQGAAQPNNIGPTPERDREPEEGAPANIEEVANDQIVSYLARRFRGHELARLVGELLKTQGYQVRVSPPGADGGIDIIAGTGPMGFDRPRLAVQVKSSDSPVDVGVLRELQGVMPRFGAEQD